MFIFIQGRVGADPIQRDDEICFSVKDDGSQRWIYCHCELSFDVSEISKGRFVRLFGIPTFSSRKNEDSIDIFVHLHLITVVPFNFMSL